MEEDPEPPFWGFCHIETAIVQIIYYLFIFLLFYSDFNCFSKMISEY